jgi:hypothetical protein
MKLEYQDWARMQGRGPHIGGRNDSDRPLGRRGWRIIPRMWWSLGIDNHY